VKLCYDGEQVECLEALEKLAEVYEELVENRTMLEEYVGWMRGVKDGIGARERELLGLLFKSEEYNAEWWEERGYVE